MKKEWLIITFVCMSGILNACGESKKSTSVTQQTTEIQTTIDDSTTTVETEGLKKATLEAHNLIPPRAVEKDTTGEWFYTLVSDMNPPSEYAFDYYNNVVGDGEIHFIINLKLNTVTKIKNGYTGIEVITTEFTKGEEKDARTLGSGYELEKKILNFDTGEPYTVEVNAEAETVDVLDLIETVKAVAKEGIADSETITDVTFNGGALTIYVDIENNAEKFGDGYADVRISSITDLILDLEDQYYNSWDTITLDFGKFGSATLEKTMVKNEGMGKFFDYPYDILK